MPELRPFRSRGARAPLRLLAFFRVAPEVLPHLLPEGILPRLRRGSAVAELCFTRQRTIRNRLRLGPPSGFSDHLAYRFAVQFAAPVKSRFRSGDSKPSPHGAWVIRRETSSWLEARCGETLLKSKIHRARFDWSENEVRCGLDVWQEADRRLHFRGRATRPVPSNLFDSIPDVLRFLDEERDVRPPDPFASGADHFDPAPKNQTLEPLQLDELDVALFQNESIYPSGSIEFDCAYRLVSKNKQSHGAAAHASQRIVHRSSSLCPSS